MAAYAALVSVMNIIEQMMSHPRLSTALDKKQIESLGAKADGLLELITNTNIDGGNKEASDLESQIASAAHAAEDVIESHIVDQIPAGDCQASHGCSLLDLQQIIEEMDGIMRKGAELKEKWRAREEQAAHGDMDVVEEKQPLTTTTGKASPVGLEDDVISIMDKLTIHQPKQQIISIVGMGGMGKTTLALNVYENSFIKEHFDIRAWATVSQQYSAQEIFSKLLSSIGQSGSGNDLGLKLHQTLCGRRYLIVLDDIWSVEAWDEVRRYFPDNGNGSKIVLTTRLSDVASGCGSRSCITMKPLDEDKSWVLFCRSAFQQEHCPYPQLESVGNEIVRLCRGLPLSIVVIGGFLLKSPRTVGFWKEFAKNIKSIPNSTEKQEILDVLSLSYNHLPPHLKPCFLYMGIFREDSEIRASRIIKLWVAEGFIKPKRAQMLEEIAEGYLNDLVDRNLVLVGRYRYNGKIRSCRLHDLIRDLCLKVSEKDKFFYVNRALDNMSKERRFICPDFIKNENVHEMSDAWALDNMTKERRFICHDFIKSDYVHEMSDAPKSAPLLRSLVCRGDKLPPVVFKMLRILNMISNCSEAVVMQNLNLRFLTFQPLASRTLVWLPSSIAFIWNLQTLTINAELVVAPIEIWSMSQLRHVECTRIYLPRPLPNDCVVMGNLQTLTKAVNLRLSEEVCKRIPNTNKLHLIYGKDLEGYEECLFDHLHNLGSLHKLQSLKLVVSTFPNQSSCNADRLKCALPVSLKKLSLARCSLDWNDLTIIGSLPQLEALELVDSVKGQKWSPVNGEFLRLRFLSIVDWTCDLRCWDADSSHFPVLEKLRLEGLWHLEEIPLDIGEIPTLEVISVDGCSESAEISAMKIKEEQESLGNEGLQVQISSRKDIDNRKLRDEEVLMHLEEEVRLYIGEITTLVDGCSESADVSAMKIKEEEESLGNEGLQVQISSMKYFSSNINCSLEISSCKAVRLSLIVVKEMKL
ncbi:putative late blight resistance protein homolog R1A-10 [Salvia miltiorrhiza]|uniref:putative late blight resistance protein homolog R1A-10 n=1 Tax=Salvia miltiorrhiza TaxID=226208 RepID=UPI0025AB6E18|nr:putative late blight resistance protein homolog R1A-10 [Salvia miltiorrhiza]